MHAESPAWDTLNLADGWMIAAARVERRWAGEESPNSAGQCAG